MNRGLAFIGGLVALAVLVGCGKDKVVLGLGYTYEQVLANSTGFQIDQERPFRWRFDEATVQLDTGDGTLFTLDVSSAHGFANHPNPSQLKLEVSDWMGAYLIGASLFNHELVPLEEARLPETAVALMAAIRASGWTPRRSSVTSVEIKTVLAVPPYRDEWRFDVDGRFIVLTMWWQRENQGKADVSRAGVHMAVSLEINEPINAITTPNLLFTKDHIMVTE